MRKRAGWRVIILASLSAGSVVAQSADAPPTDPSLISRADDLERTCEELAAEASTLTERMGAGGQPTLFGRLGGLARTGAQFLPGGALVVAGADALTGPDREARDAEAEATRYRWHYLNGLYLGRDCEPPPATPTVPPSNSGQVPSALTPQVSPQDPPLDASPANAPEAPTVTMTPPDGPASEPARATPTG